MKIYDIKTVKLASKIKLSEVLDEESAEEVVSQLIYAEQRGIISHGLIRIK